MNAAAVVTAGSGICLSIPQSQVQVSAPGVDQNGVSFESSFCQSSVGGGASAAKDSGASWCGSFPPAGKVPSSVTKNRGQLAVRQQPGVSQVTCC